jgi:hypothetical protein
MAVRLEQIKVGAVFSFKTGTRRVVTTSTVSDRGFNVGWEYADGKKRAGRLGGEQWCHYFRKDAIAEVPQEAQGAHDTRTLRSGRIVAGEAEPRTLSITSRCPAKWAMVDLETGDVWVDHGGSLGRAGDEVMKDLSAAISR